jgi:hypothetical protein
VSNNFLENKPNHVTEYFRSWNGKNTIFQIDGKASGGQGRKKMLPSE